MLFWVGMIVGAGLALLVTWLRNKDITPKWYEWVLGVAGILSAFAAVQHYFGSVRESELASAWMGALLFGVLAVIFLLVTWRLVLNHHKAV